MNKPNLTFVTFGCIIIRVGGMSWPSGAMQYRAQLELTDKGFEIKGLFVSCVLFIRIDQKRGYFNPKKKLVNFIAIRNIFRNTS